MRYKVIYYTMESILKFMMSNILFFSQVVFEKLQAAHKFVSKEKKQT